MKTPSFEEKITDQTAILIFSIRWYVNAMDELIKEEK